MAATIRIATLISTLVLLAPFKAAQTYEVTDLGTFPGGTVSQGQALSDRGDVVGYARFADYNAHGFFWTEKTGLLDLGAIPPQSNFSVAQAINSHGIVAGYSTYDYPPLLNELAVLWIEGRIQDLGTLPGSDISEAMAMNDRGDVVGFSVPNAFLWTRKDGMQDLGTLPGGYYSQALAISPRSEVVGFSNASDGNWHAFLWTESEGMQALPYLSSGDSSASANGINRHGQIVGGSGNFYSGNFAVLWHRRDHVENLGVLPGEGWSTAFAINGRGQVVGWSGFRAFMWSRDEGMRDLNDLIPSNSGWFLSLATAINERGQITGQGSINGQSHTFLLTPNCEPSRECEDSGSTAN